MHLNVKCTQNQTHLNFQCISISNVFEYQMYFNIKCISTSNASQHQNLFDKYFIHVEICIFSSCCIPWKYID